MQDELDTVRAQLVDSKDECVRLKQTLAMVDSDIHELTEKLFGVSRVPCSPAHTVHSDTGSIQNDVGCVA